MQVLLVLTLSMLTKTIHSSVPFLVNPGCDLPQCKELGHPAVYYANHFVNEKTVHVIYSSLDELTISVFETAKGYGPTFNYTALFAKNYAGAIQFGDTKPSNSISLILRRLMAFNDKDNNGQLRNDDNTIVSYPLTDVKTTNATFQNSNSTQPMFQFPLTGVRAIIPSADQCSLFALQINGSVTVDIVFPGESMRDSKFPKLQSTPKSFFLNIALQATNFPLANTRFAFELYIISFGVEGARLLTSKFIDDHYTPGKTFSWHRASNTNVPRRYLQRLANENRRLVLPGCHALEARGLSERRSFHRTEHPDASLSNEKQRHPATNDRPGYLQCTLR